MAQGISYEDLLKQGATPHQTQAKADAAPVSLEELRASGAEAPPQVGGVETFLNSGANALPFGKPTVDALIALITKAHGATESGVKLTPQAKADLVATGEELPPERIEQPDLIDSYRNARDTRNERADEGSKQNPWASRAGTATGILSTLPLALPAAKIGTGLAGRVVSGIATGAGYGGLTALTNGKADLTRGEFGQAGRDVAGIDALKAAAAEAKAGNYKNAALDALGAGAPGGALAGGLLGSAVEIVGPRLAPLLEKLGIAQGRRVLTNGADLATSTKDPVSAAAVRKSIESGAMPAFSDTAGVYSNLEKLSSQRAATYNEIVQRLEAKGVKGPVATELADQLLAKATDDWSNTGANKSTSDYLLNEGQNAQAIANPDGTLGLGQALKVTRRIYKDAKHGRIEDTAMNEALLDAGGVYRRGIEDTVGKAGEAAPAGSAVRADAEAFVPVKKDLGLLIEAKKAARHGTARASAKQSGYMPSAMEAGMAVQSGNPLVLAVKPTLGFLKARGTSAVAAGSLKLSNALRSGEAASVGARMVEQAAPAQNIPQAAAMVPAAAQGGKPPDDDGMTVRYVPPEKPKTPISTLKSALKMNPQAFGRFAQPLMEAAGRNDSALAVANYMLAQQYPGEYDEILKGLSHDGQLAAQK